MQPSSSDIQQKRLQKELSMLARVPKGIAVKESPRTSGLSLIVSPSKAIQVEIQREKVEAQKYLESNISSIKFEIMIEHSFPFSAPRILCRTSVRPSAHSLLSSASHRSRTAGICSVMCSKNNGRPL